MVRFELPESFLDSLSEKEKENFSSLVLVKTSLLDFADWNYKEDDPNMQDSLDENIKKLGQIENVHIREKEGGRFEVLNGNHRLKTFKKNGVSYALAYNHGNISLKEAVERALMTNETKFKADTLKLADLVVLSLDDESPEDLAKRFPFSAQQIIEFKEASEFDWNKFNEEKEDDGFSSLTFKLSKDQKLKYEKLCKKHELGKNDLFLEWLNKEKL